MPARAWGFKSPLRHAAMSRDTVHRCLGTSFTFGLWLVIPSRIELEVAKQLAVGGGDPHVQVFHEDQHWSASVAPADADVMQPAAVAQGELAIGVDSVVAHAEVRVDERGP